MADYHCSINIISRATGRSSVAAAAYRACERLANERDGRVHDYRRKGGHVHSEITLPDGAPERFRDRGALWNEVERVEKQDNAQVAREIVYALPVELGTDDQVALARKIAEDFASDGMCADWSVHDVDGHNPHCHMMLTLRPIAGDGFGAKSVKKYIVRDARGGEKLMTTAELKDANAAVGNAKWEKTYRYRGGRVLTMSQAAEAGLNPTKDRTSRYAESAKARATNWDEPERAEEWRKRVADRINAALAADGSCERVDHRSYLRQGLEGLTPTRHEGPKVTAMERRAERAAKEAGDERVPVTDMRAENLATAALNRSVEDLWRQQRRYAATREAARRAGVLVRLGDALTPTEAQMRARHKHVWKDDMRGACAASLAESDDWDGYRAALARRGVRAELAWRGDKADVRYHIPDGSGKWVWGATLGRAYTAAAVYMRLGGDAEARRIEAELRETGGAAMRNATVRALALPQWATVARVEEMTRATGERLATVVDALETAEAAGAYTSAELVSRRVWDGSASDRALGRAARLFAALEARGAVVPVQQARTSGEVSARSASAIQSGPRACPTRRTIAAQRSRAARAMPLARERDRAAAVRARDAAERAARFPAEGERYFYRGELLVRHGNKWHDAEGAIPQDENVKAVFHWRDHPELREGTAGFAELERGAVEGRRDDAAREVRGPTVRHDDRPLGPDPHPDYPDYQRPAWRPRGR